MEDAESLRQKKLYCSSMEDVESLRSWAHIDHDVLHKIFNCFDYVAYSSSAVSLVRCSLVCTAWRSILCDSRRWTTLDLSWLKSNFINIQQQPYVYVDTPSEAKLTRVLKLSLSLSRGHITTLIFNPELYISDDQFTYTANRCRNLRRLVLPTGDRIKKAGMCRAIRNWPELESLTLPGIMHPPDLMKDISNYCRNLRELKIMGRFHVLFASALVETYLPNLKVLSLRCTLLLRKVLIALLDGLPQLRVLNISHCVLLSEAPRPDEPLWFMEEIDGDVLEKAARLERFITCMGIDRCIMCQRARTHGGNMKWYKYEQGLWKQDEVKSLAL